MAGLARMANRDHRFVEIQPGDTVIVSASPIPGNEEYVARTIDNLFKAGANVYYHTIKRAHVSGHASQEELKLMLGLTKPKHFIPIHGEFRMQVQHGRLAIETGVAPENVFIIENGTPIEIYADGIGPPRPARSPAGYVYVDGLSVGEVGDVVLRDRRALANDGMFMIVVTVDKQTGIGHRPAGDHHPRLRPPATSTTRSWTRRVDRVDRSRSTPGRPHQRDRPAQDARSRTASRATCTSRRSGDRWSSRSSSRSERGDPSPSGDPQAADPPVARHVAGRARGAARLSPEVVRSIIGLVLLVLGAMTLIALILPGPGRADRAGGATSSRRGSGRCAGCCRSSCCVAGWWLEWGPGKRPDRAGGSRCSGWRITYAGVLGAAQVARLSSGRPGRPAPGRHARRDLVRPGRRVRPARRRSRSSASSSASASRSASCSTRRSGRRAGSAPPRPRRCAGRRPRRRRRHAAAAAAATRATNGRGAGRTARPSRPAPSPGQTGVWGDERGLGHPGGGPEHSGQTSATFAPARGAGAASAHAGRPGPARCATSTTSPTPATRRRPRTGSSTSCRRSTTLEDIAIPLHAGGDEAVHARNEEIIVKKLAGLRDPGPDRRRATRARSSPSTRSSRRRTSRSAGSRRSPTTWRWPSPPARSGSRRRSRARARSASRSPTRTSTSSPCAGSSRRSSSRRRSRS